MPKTQIQEEQKLSDIRINNDIDFLRIMNGEEKRTTVMVRNIPNKFK